MVVPVAMLEVIALNAVDAARAEAGGADRLELVGTMDQDGLSPTPREVDLVRAATSIQIRPMVRLRGGFGTDAAERGRMRELVAAYREAGADGVVLGFLTDAGHVDVDGVAELVGDGSLPWTFHRAIDHCGDPDQAWTDLLKLPGLTSVLTAGSPHGVADGVANLTARAADPRAASLILAGGGLRPDHVHPLLQAGVRAFHIGSPARPSGSFTAPVDPDLVARWRALVDELEPRVDQVGSIP